MGLVHSRFLMLCEAPKRVRIWMLGLDGAGKTTIFNWLIKGELVATIPTQIGFNVETLEFGAFSFTIWEGRLRNHQHWKHYLHNTQALIYVVDCSDVERIEETRKELHKMLNEDELKDAKLLVFAHKNDLPNGMATNEVMDRMGLKSLKGRDWYIQSSNAQSGEGIFEVFTWLERIL